MNWKTAIIRHYLARLPSTSSSVISVYDWFIHLFGVAIKCVQSYWKKRFGKSCKSRKEHPGHTLLETLVLCGARPPQSVSQLASWTSRNLTCFARVHVVPFFRMLRKGIACLWSLCFVSFSRPLFWKLFIFSFSSPSETGIFSFIVLTWYSTLDSFDAWWGSTSSNRLGLSSASCKIEKH